MISRYIACLTFEILHHNDMFLVKRHRMQQAVRVFFLLLLENRVNAFVDILCTFNLKG